MSKELTVYKILQMNGRQFFAELIKMVGSPARDDHRLIIILPKSLEGILMQYTRIDDIKSFWGHETVYANVDRVIICRESE